MYKHLAFLVILFCICESVYICHDDPNYPKWNNWTDAQIWTNSDNNQHGVPGQNDIVVIGRCSVVINDGLSVNVSGLITWAYGRVMIAGNLSITNDYSGSGQIFVNDTGNLNINKYFKNTGIITCLNILNMDTFSYDNSGQIVLINSTLNLINTEQNLGMITLYNSTVKSDRLIKIVNNTLTIYQNCSIVPGLDICQGILFIYQNSTLHTPSYNHHFGHLAIVPNKSLIIANNVNILTNFKVHLENMINYNVIKFLIGESSFNTTFINLNNMIYCNDHYDITVYQDSSSASVFILKKHFDNKNVIFIIFAIILVIIFAVILIAIAYYKYRNNNIYHQLDDL